MTHALVRKIGLLVSLVCLGGFLGCLVPESTAIKSAVDNPEIELEKAKIRQTIENFGDLFSRDGRAAIGGIRASISNDLSGTWTNSTANTPTFTPTDSTQSTRSFNAQSLSISSSNNNSGNSSGQATFSFSQVTVTGTWSWTFVSAGQTSNQFTFFFDGFSSPTNKRTIAQGSAIQTGLNSIQITNGAYYHTTSSQSTQKDLTESWLFNVTLTRSASPAPSINNDLTGTWRNKGLQSFLLNPTDQTNTTNIQTIASLILNIANNSNGNSSGQGVWTFANNQTLSGTWSWVFVSGNSTQNNFQFSFSGSLNNVLNIAQGTAIQTSVNEITITNGSFYQTINNQSNVKDPTKSWLFSTILERTTNPTTTTTTTTTSTTTGGSTGNIYESSGTKEKDTTRELYPASQVGNNGEFFLRDIQNNENHKFKIDANGFKFPDGTLNSAIVRTAYIGKPIGSVTAEEVLVPALLVVDFYLLRDDQLGKWFIDQMIIISGQYQSEDLPVNKAGLDEGHDKRNFSFTGPFNTLLRGNFRGPVQGLSGVSVLSLNIDQNTPELVGEMVSDNTAVWGSQPLLNVKGLNNDFECVVTLNITNTSNAKEKITAKMVCSFNGTSTLNGSIDYPAANLKATMVLSRQ